MEIPLTSFDPKRLFHQLDRRLPGKLLKMDFAHRFEFANADIDGTASCYEFKKAGINFYTLQFSAKTDLAISVKDVKFQPMRMIYCISGAAEYGLSSEPEPYNLEPLVKLLVSIDGKNEHRLKLKKGDLILHIIDLEKETFIQNRDKMRIVGLPRKLAQALKDFRFNRNFIHRASFDLSLSGVLNEISAANAYKGIVQRLFVESKILEVIALTFHHLNVQELYGQRSVLKKEDIERIINARNILHADLKNAPTIRELARLAGINENKLKVGFRKLFNETINESITNHRLSLARILLAQQELSIKDIAAEVGYQSSSHFTKQFKKKFGVRPKDFLHKIQMDVSDN